MITIRKKKEVLMPFRASGYFPNEEKKVFYRIDIALPVISFFRDYDAEYDYSGRVYAVHFYLKPFKRFPYKEEITEYTYKVEK